MLSPQPQQHRQALRRWLAPILLSVALMYGLGFFYIGSTLDPSVNLRHFPIAIVNQDNGLAGRLVTDGLAKNMDKDQFDVRVLTPDQARHQMETAAVYAQASIPADFSQRLFALPAGMLQTEPPTKPVITISTSPHASTVAGAIAERALRKALAAANVRAGKMLSTQLEQQEYQGKPLPGAEALALGSPIDIESSPHMSGSNAGTGALYLSLLLVIGGVSIAVLVGRKQATLLDYLSTGFKPLARRITWIQASRRQSLLFGWSLTVLLAPPTALVCLGIALLLGVSVPYPVATWVFAALVVSVVGVLSTSLISGLGKWGALISAMVFIFLGLPATGAAIPLEASPSFLGWLAGLEPMHQSFMGIRSLLSVGGAADAALTQSLVMCLLGLCAGVLLGFAIMWAQIKLRRARADLRRDLLTERIYLREDTATKPLRRVVDV